MIEGCCRLQVLSANNPPTFNIFLLLHRHNFMILDDAREIRNHSKRFIGLLPKHFYRQLLSRDKNAECARIHETKKVMFGGGSAVLV